MVCRLLFIPTHVSHSLILLIQCITQFGIYPWIFVNFYINFSCFPGYKFAFAIFVLIVNACIFFKKTSINHRCEILVVFIAYDAILEIRNRSVPIQSLMGDLEDRVILDNMDDLGRLQGSYPESFVSSSLFLAEI